MPQDVLFPGRPAADSAGDAHRRIRIQLETKELFALIKLHLPGTPIIDIVAECQRQGAAARAEAEALERYLEDRSET
jgi:hypothetical protein